MSTRTMREFCKEYLVDEEGAQIMCSYCQQKCHRENRKGKSMLLLDSHARTYEAYDERELYRNGQQKLSTLLVYKLITCPILHWFLIDVKFQEKHYSC